MQREMTSWFCLDSFAGARLVSFALLIASALVVGCSREVAKTPQSAEKSGKAYTEAELSQLIVPGMNAAEVEIRFGSPGSRIEMGKDVVMWTYSFPLRPSKLEPHLGGFSLYIKDGKVERWSPIMEESRQTLQPGSTQGLFGEQSFQIFVATGDLTNIANAVDVNGSADGSDLKTLPDLEFKGKVFSGNSGVERQSEESVIIVVNEQDASKLKDITENNFGKRLLIVSRNVVIAAPTISSPLASRQLMFTVKTPTVLNSIQAK